MTLKLAPHYLTDEKGKKSAVVINIHDYENLLEYLEDLEDACDLLKAERMAKTFAPYEKFREKLKKERRI